MYMAILCWRHNKTLTNFEQNIHIKYCTRKTGLLNMKLYSGNKAQCLINSVLEFKVKVTTHKNYGYGLLRYCLLLICKGGVSTYDFKHVKDSHDIVSVSFTYVSII